MTIKELKKYNLVNDIYHRLFGLSGSISGRDGSGNYFNKYSYDVSYGDAPTLDITKTSGNLDFTVKTFQSRSENIYFYVGLYDYERREDIPAGYFYIKDNHGRINRDHTRVLYDIIDAGTDITESIFDCMNKSEV